MKETEKEKEREEQNQGDTRRGNKAKISGWTRAQKGERCKKKKRCGNIRGEERVPECVMTEWVSC